MSDVRYRAPGGPTTGSAPHRVDKMAAIEPLAGSWLDVGCGEGSYTTLLVEQGCERAVGIDLGLQRPLFQNDQVTYVLGASERLPFAAGTFDGVLLNEVLEHVDDEVETLRDIRRVLDPTGRLVVFSPNRWFPFEGHGATVAGHDIEAPVPFLPWLPSGLSRRWMRARNYWPSELAHLVESAGFRIEAQGFAFPLFVKVNWLPARAGARVREWAPRLETTTAVRRFGVSTMLQARPC